MTKHDYVSMKREIRRLEAADPSPNPSSSAAVKLYTLKAAAMAYEEGLYPEDDVPRWASMWASIRERAGRIRPSRTRHGSHTHH